VQNNASERSIVVVKLKYAIYISLLLGLYFLGNAGYMLAKANLAQILLERSWNQALAQTSSEFQRPWPWADFYPAAKLTFVGLKSSYIVANIDSGQALAFAPGFSAKNISGDDGVSIISAHNDSHFSVLESLKWGDELMLEDRSKTIKYYRVENAYVIDTRSEFIQLDASVEDSKELILVTCYPFKGVEPSTPYRYIVQASYIRNDTIAVAHNL